MSACEWLTHCYFGCRILGLKGRCCICDITSISGSNDDWGMENPCGLTRHVRQDFDMVAIPKLTSGKWVLGRLEYGTAY
jgi:hypothetical protein